MAIITAADLKTHLGKTSTSDDVLLGAMANAAEAAVRKILERVIEPSDITAEFHDGGYESIWLKNYPVNSLSKLELDGDDWLPDVTYVPETGEIFLTDGGKFPPGRRIIEADYNAGWQAVPADIKQAAVITAAAWYNRRGSEGKATVLMSDGTAQNISDEIPKETIQLLRPYRKATLR